MSDKERFRAFTHAILATDIVLLRYKNKTVQYATHMIDRPPHYIDIHGVIGGVVLPSETAREAACRIMTQKTSLPLSAVHFEQLGFYDALDRDLRGRVVSLAFVGIVHDSDDDGGLQWNALHSRMKLAYDHTRMIADTVALLRRNMFSSNLLLSFMRQTFIAADLKNVYEYIHGAPIDKRNFYKHLLALPIRETQTFIQPEKGRPARVFQKTQKK